MEWMKDPSLHNIALFIPANLTAVDQSLDKYLIACLKRMLCQLQNEQNIERVVESLGTRTINGGPIELESGKVTILSTFKPLLVLSELKEIFFTNLENVLTSLQNPEKDQSWTIIGKGSV